MVFAFLHRASATGKIIRSSLWDKRLTTDVVQLIILLSFMLGRGWLITTVPMWDLSPPLRNSMMPSLVFIITASSEYLPSSMLSYICAICTPSPSFKKLIFQTELIKNTPYRMVYYIINCMRMGVKSRYGRHNSNP